MSETWLTVPQFSLLANISRRAGLKAASGASAGQLWRNANMIVRSVPGRGGRSGVRYEVALSSLP